MGKEPKLVAKMGLCRSQCHGGAMTNAMQSDLPNTVWDVVQADRRDSTSGIDEPHRVLRSQAEAF